MQKEALDEILDKNNSIFRDSTYFKNKKDFDTQNQCVKLFNYQIENNNLKPSKISDIFHFKNNAFSQKTIEAFSTESVFISYDKQSLDNKRKKNKSNKNYSNGQQLQGRQTVKELINLCSLITNQF